MLPKKKMKNEISLAKTIVSHKFKELNVTEHVFLISCVMKHCVYITNLSHPCRLLLDIHTIPKHRKAGKNGTRNPVSFVIPCYTIRLKF